MRLINDVCLFFYLSNKHKKQQLKKRKTRTQSHCNTHFQLTNEIVQFE